MFPSIGFSGGGGGGGGGGRGGIGKSCSLVACCSMIMNVVLVFGVCCVHCLFTYRTPDGHTALSHRQLKST